LHDTIEIGLPDKELNFSQPVKLVFEGQAGKKVGWTRESSGALNKITTVCNNANNPTNIDSTTTRQCYIDSGNNLIVFTYHFTIFGIFTDSSSGGSGGGGGSSSSIYDMGALDTKQIEKDLRESDTLKFTFNNQEHTLRLDYIYYHDDEIRVTIRSTPQRFTLKQNTPVAVDLDENNKYDINIWFEFTSTRQAKIYIEKIIEKDNTDTIIEEEKDDTGKETDNNNKGYLDDNNDLEDKKDTDTIIEENDQKEDKPFSPVVMTTINVIVVLFIIQALIMIIFLMFVTYDNNKNRHLRRKRAYYKRKIDMMKNYNRTVYYYDPNDYRNKNLYKKDE